MDIYSIVDDPSNPLLAIFGLVLAPLGFADLARIGQAARLRRGMSDADIARLGGTLAKRMGTIRKLTGSCRAR